MRLPDHKAATSELQAVDAALPERLVLPLEQHIGVVAGLCVVPGTTVSKGQPLTTGESPMNAMIHAPTSGVVETIADLPVSHPGGTLGPCVVLRPDGRDAWGSRDPLTDTGAAPLMSHLQRMGVIGLGGAGFPSHVKLAEAMQQPVEMLIINGVECEPYITCDDRLIRERSDEVIAGARILASAAQARQCVIALEEHMREALAVLRARVAEEMEVVSVPAVYPAGGEKQLVKALTGREVPSSGLPIDVGALMFNVATAVAVYRAVTLGEPLLERYVTVAGDGVEAGNRRVRIGTPVASLLPGVDTEQFHVIMGGPMMGTRLLDLDVPVTKTSNCLLVQRRESAPAPVMPCIRCGDCVAVCPAGLNPQALYESARASDLDYAQDLQLFDCIECGCCAYVCPSHLPLVHYYRYAKSQIDGLDQKTARADVSRRRFMGRETRQGAGREEAAAPQSEEVPGRAQMRAEIDAARERVRRKQAARNGAEEPDGD